MNDFETNMNGGIKKNKTRYLPFVLAALALGLTALTSFLFSTGFALLAVLVSAICAGIFSALLTSTRSMLCAVVLPAAFAAAFFTGGIWCAAFSVTFAAVSSVVLICIQKKTGSAAAVNYSTAAVCVFVLLLTVVLIALSNGRLSVELFRNEFDSFFDDLGKTLTETLAGSGYTQVIENTLSAYSMSVSEFVTAIVTTVKYLSPSLFIAAIWLYSFISVQFFKATVFILSLTLVLPDPKWRYEPNVISARVYLADYFLYLFVSFFSDGSGVVQIAVENLLYILLFPMMAVGISSVLVNLRNPILRGRSFFTIAIVAAALIFMPTVFPFLIAMMGAFFIIFKYRRQKAKQSSDNNGGSV